MMVYLNHLVNDGMRIRGTILEFIWDDKNGLSDRSIGWETDSHRFFLLMNHSWTEWLENNVLVEMKGRNYRGQKVSSGPQHHLEPMQRIKIYLMGSNGGFWRENHFRYLRVTGGWTRVSTCEATMKNVLTKEWEANSFWNRMQWAVTWPLLVLRTKCWSKPICRKEDSSH